MARIITEIYPIAEREEPADVSHIVSEGSEDSIAEDKEQSIFGKLLHLSRQCDSGLQFCCIICQSLPRNQLYFH